MKQIVCRRWKPACLQVAAVLALGASSALAGADAVLPVAGTYDGLVVAYDKTSRVVSGYFHEETGQGQFSCIFYFSGVMDGNQSVVTSYFPETPQDAISGTFALTSDANHTLTLQLQKEHGGCANVRHFADASPVIFNRFSQNKAWLAIDVVKADKSYFSEEPNELSRQRAYVVKGDAVAVLGEENGWVRVEYAGYETVTTGYLLASDLYGLPARAGVRIPQQAAKP